MWSCWSAGAKFRTMKILKAWLAILWNFTPAKISRYTVSVLCLLIGVNLLITSCFTSFWNLFSLSDFRCWAAFFRSFFRLLKPARYFLHNYDMYKVPIVIKLRGIGILNNNIPSQKFNSDDLWHNARLVLPLIQKILSNTVNKLYPIQVIMTMYACLPYLWAT